MRWVGLAFLLIATTTVAACLSVAPRNLGDPGTDDSPTSSDVPEQIVDSIEQDALPLELAAKDPIAIELEATDLAAPENCNEVVWGAGSCIDIIACITKNSCAAESCVAQCRSAGKQAAASQYDALVACRAQSCPQTASTLDALSCTYQTCRTANEPCVQAGSQSCGQIMTCIGSCADTGSGCVLSCLGGGMYDAQLAFIAANACTAKNCSDLSGDAWTACVDQDCSSQMAACSQ